MKPKIPLDEQFREKLEHVAPEVPAHIWENIRQKTQKRRFAFWYSSNLLLVLLIILGVVTGGVYWWNRNEDKQQLALSSKRPSVSTPSSKETTMAPTEQSATTTNLSEQLENKPAAGIQSKETQTYRVEKQKSTVDVGYPKEGPDVDVSLQHPLDSENRSSLDEKTTQSQSNSIKKRSNRNIGSRSKMKVIAATPVTSSEPFTAVLTEEAVGNTSRIMNDITVLQANDSLIQKVNPALAVDSVQSLKTTVSAGSQNVAVPVNTDKKVDIPCPGGNNAAANRKYMDVYGSFDYGIRQFSDTANSTYLQSRKESTRFHSAFSGGLRYTRVFNNGISIRAGLNVTQINETFRFVQGNIIQVVYIINANGDTTGSYQTQSTRYKTTRNQYRTLDIPLTIGYEYGKGKWFVNASGGVMINLRSWSRGDVLDYSLQPVNINESAPTSVYQFKTNIGWAGMLTGALSYQAGKNIRLFGEPYFRFNFSTMSKDEITLKQKYHLIGLRLGVRMDFKK